MAGEKIARYHRQLGIFASLWLVLAALTALALNHRDLWLTPASSGPAQSPYAQYLLSHAQSPHTPGLTLVGTSEGLFLSADAGKTFHEVALPVKATQVVGVAFHPINPEQVYAALRQGLIFSSQDGGKKWDRVPFPGTATIQSFSLGKDGSLQVLSSSGIYSRIGESWNLIPRPEPQAGEENSRKWLRWVYDLHDGQFWGRAAVFVTDCLSVAILLLVGSGLWMAWKKPCKVAAA